MTVLMFSLLRAILLFTHASHYHPGVIERAAFLNHQPQAACMVASLDYKLGTRLMVYSITTGQTWHCLVVDSVKKRDRAAHIANNIHIEFGYRSIGPLCGLHYYGEELPSACSVVVWRAR